jgi:hypothetical protein
LNFSSNAHENAKNQGFFSNSNVRFGERQADFEFYFKTRTAARKAYRYGDDLVGYLKTAQNLHLLLVRF